MAAFGIEDSRHWPTSSAPCATHTERKLSNAGICLCGILAAEHAGLPEPVGKALNDYFVACRNGLILAFVASGAGEPEKRATVFQSASTGATLLMSNAMGDPTLSPAWRRKQ